MDGWQIAYIWPDSTPKGDAGEYYKVGDILSLEEIKAMGTVYSPTVFIPAVAELRQRPPGPGDNACATRRPAVPDPPRGRAAPRPRGNPAPEGPQAPEEAIPEADVPLAEARSRASPDSSRRKSPSRTKLFPWRDPGKSAWALLNLILAVLTVLGSAVLLVTWFTRRKQREEEQEEATEREQRKEVKRHGLVRLFSLIPALGAVIAFVLTENMKNPMAFTDKWTLLMVVIFVIQLVVMLLARKSDETEENGPDKGPAAANV